MEKQIFSYIRKMFHLVKGDFPVPGGNCKF